MRDVEKNFLSLLTRVEDYDQLVRMQLGPKPPVIQPRSSIYPARSTNLLLTAQLKSTASTNETNLSLTRLELHRMPHIHNTAEMDNLSNIFPVVNMGVGVIMVLGICSHGGCPG